MRICHITSAHARYDGRIFKKQCCSLAKAGHEVVLLCADGKKEETLQGVLIKSCTLKPLSKRQRMKLLLFPARFAKEALRTEADVYQFHDIELLTVGLELKKRNKKVIFDCHENWEGYIREIAWLPQFITRILARRLTLFYKHNLNKYDAVFTVSPNILKNLSQYSGNVSFVPNYPIIGMKGIQAKAGAQSNTFIYSGTVYPMSNQETILQALGKIPEAAYMIIGQIEERQKQQLKQLPAADRVKFVDWVSKEELDRYYEKALAGIVVFDYVEICCKREGQLGSNKIFEYMAMGLPVICTDFSLWKEMIVDKYHCGIAVAPRNVKAVYEAMKYLIENPKQARQMGANGQKAVKEEFNWEKYEPGFIQNYVTINKKS